MFIKSFEDIFHILFSNLLFTNKDMIFFISFLLLIYYLYIQGHIASFYSTKTKLIILINSTYYKFPLFNFVVKNICFLIKMFLKVKYFLIRLLNIFCLSHETSHEKPIIGRRPCPNRKLFIGRAVAETSAAVINSTYRSADRGVSQLIREGVGRVW